ncbi:MAG: 50S ribosomal protein L32 [Candidatus Omnitrophica bacterium]|nr:50S ribosomal protein L32 [Candidatus Omnitrophota bacterium]
MAHPKRQHSKQRSRKRRTHYKAEAPAVSVCSNCKKEIVPHRVCPYCGHYKGKLVVEIKVKEAKKKK